MTCSPAAPPMQRAGHWKHAFFGSRCEACGTGHLPPQRVCVKCAAVDQMREERFSEASCKVATYTLDHLAYTLQPPVVAAIVDFEGGGRLSCELTDVDPKSVAIGNEHGVEPLSTCSVVVAPVRVEGEHLGTVGVLGPTRMNYPQALAAVEVVSDRLGKRLAEG